MPFVAQRIHGVPKPSVAVSRKLSFGAQLLQRLLLEDRLVTFDVIDDLRGKHQKPSIDPRAVTSGLLVEAKHIVIGIQIESTETPGGLHRGNGRRQPPFIVIGQQSGDIDFRQTVAICEAKISSPRYSHARGGCGRRSLSRYRYPPT